MSKKTFMALLCIALVFTFAFFSLTVFSEGTANTEKQTRITDVQSSSQTPTTTDTEPYEASKPAKILAITLSSLLVVVALVVAIRRPKD